MNFSKRHVCWIAAITIVLSLAGGAMAADAEIGVVRQRIVDSFIPADAEARETIMRAAAQAATSQKSDGSWEDIDYSNQTRADWPLEQHLDRAFLMAKACEMNRRNSTPDSAMTAKALHALDWWLGHDPQNPNWWWNQIGVPQHLGETMLLTQPDATPEEITKTVAIMRRSNWEKKGGQNLVWGCEIQVLRGCVENDAGAIGQAYARMFKEVVIQPRDKEGIQPDYSFHQHGMQFYSGGYGQGFARDVTRFAAFSWGTKWQIPGNTMAVLNSYVLDGEQWVMHYSRTDFSSLGRGITRKGEMTASKSETIGSVALEFEGYRLLKSAEMISNLPVPRQAEWKEFAKHLAENRAGSERLAGNRMYWCSDYMAHHEPGWFASIKMFSRRMQNTELGNDEGKKSHHLADGAMLLYLTGTEYTDIFPVWDWCRIPGTTAEQVTDLNAWEPGGNQTKGKTSFVGGVSDGSVGIAAMDLQRKTLKARKMYVCTEDGVLCLGAGISCDSDNDVLTAVNQCHLRGDVEQGQNLAWVKHAGVMYLFPGKQNVRLSTTTQRGRWRDVGPGSDQEEEQAVFSLSIDHGKNARDGAYVYFVAPAATDAKATELEAKFPAVVLSNTTAAQVARSVDGACTAAVFWEAGKVGNIEADHPCAVLVRGGTVNVSDPSEKLDAVNVRVDGVPYQIELPKGPRAGASVAVKLKPARLEGL